MDSEDSRDVLRDVVNEGVESPEDEDFALAKILQEQERAFFHARAMYADGENGGEYFGYGEFRESEEDPEGLADREASGSPQADVSGDHEEELGGDELGEEGIDDEELARRLHIQEEMDLHRRLMELAGVHQVGDEYTEDEEDEYLTDDSVDPDDMTYEELRALGDAVGVVSRGAAIDVIKALPLARYSSSAAAGCAGTNGQDEQCVVCRMEFENGEDVKVLPCKHVFHPDCVDQWLHINKVCPICSQEVTAAERRGVLEGQNTKPSKS